MLLILAFSVAHSAINLARLAMAILTGGAK